MTGCDHRATVWRVSVIHPLSHPFPSGWECTRCGEHWDRDPTPTLVLT